MGDDVMEQYLKILDCIGDIYLTGYKIIGKIVCSQGGHKLTNQLLRKVFQQNENFSLIEITEKHLPNTRTVNQTLFCLFMTKIILVTLIMTAFHCLMTLTRPQRYKMQSLLKWEAADGQDT